MRRINTARVFVSAGDFGLTYTQFLHDGIMQLVDEVIGTARSVEARRHGQHMRAIRQSLERQ
jgi:hypothetical protein